MVLIIVGRGVNPLVQIVIRAAHLKDAR